jgi:hypothetical protein
MSDRSAELTCFYFGVGQGLFNAGLLKENDGSNQFAWVYDCGRNCEDEDWLIDRGIRTLCDKLTDGAKGQVAKPVINLLIISHFDRDHITGINALLKEFRVERVLLPFADLAQRIMAAFDQGLEPTAAEFQYFVNPVRYLAGIEGSGIDEIVIVPPSDPEQPVPIPNADQPVPDGPWVLEVQSTRDLGSYGGAEGFLNMLDSKVALSVLREQTTLLLSGFWEFVPYNDAELANRVSPTFAAGVKQLSSDLINDTLPAATRETALSELKKLYASTFAQNRKKNARNNNLISLFISAGTTRAQLANGSHREYSRWEREFDKPDKRFEAHQCKDIYMVVDSGHQGVRLLYTGDGFLDSPARFVCLRTYLGTARISQLSILQVMHHGSEANWFNGLAAEFSASLSVFSSDPSHHWGHPHAAVLRDFWMHGPVQVDRSQSLSVRWRIRF